jgi:hypothetical protein
MNTGLILVFVIIVKVFIQNPNVSLLVPQILPYLGRQKRGDTNLNHAMPLVQTCFPMAKITLMLQP